MNMFVTARTFTSEAEQREAIRSLRYLRDAPTHRHVDTKGVSLPSPQERPPERIPNRDDANHHVRAYRAWCVIQSAETRPTEFIKASCFITGITHEQLIGRSRGRDIVPIRHRIMRETAERYPELSSTKLGQLFKRDHTVILWAMQKKASAPKHKAKLTDQQVSEIRIKAADGRRMLKEIAADYGVSPSAVSAIVHGRSWRDVT